MIAGPQIYRRRRSYLKNSKRVTFGRKVWRRAVPLGVIASVGLLIYLEQIALLYVLATLALVALLLTVAFADLESVSKPDDASDSDSAEAQTPTAVGTATAKGTRRGEVTGTP